MGKMNISLENWVHKKAPSGVDRLTYKSLEDGLKDWALAWRPPDKGNVWVVHLHGHGSTGDQIFTREDIREKWFTRYRELGLGVLSPNLRGNAWMCPEAVSDLHHLLRWVRQKYAVRAFYLVSGSMGGTGNLIYSILHPEDVTAVVALCPVTDIAFYHEWCLAHPGDVCHDIRLAIESAYSGAPSQVPDRYLPHVVIKNAHRLTMPVFLAHATGDAVIPVQQSRDLYKLLKGKPNVEYVEIDGGDHDTPLHHDAMPKWLENILVIQGHR